MSVNELSKYIFASKYARWIPEKKRRENWSETVDRIKGMMIEKYKEKIDSDKSILDEIEWAYSLMNDKWLVGSQRTTQFAGPAIFKHFLRGYNCSATYVDRLRVFQEIMYVLLAGCGAGFSVQQHHVEKLPDFCFSKDRRDCVPIRKYIIPDSIEGWADSIGVLLSSYFNDPIFPEYHRCKVEFDFSLIRSKGSQISSCNGKAPGPEPLKKALNNIDKLIQRCINNGQTKLRPIDAHDLICHIADSVLSGGVRRAALISLFSADDEEMMKCKTGSWFYDNPQRGRANNSVVLLRNKTSFTKFNSLIKYTKEYGEPGFLWVDSLEQLTNPCQPSWAKLLTKQGIRELTDINIGDEIWSSEGWTKVTNKSSNGIKEVFKYSTTAGRFYGTENHKILQNGEKIEVGLAESIDLLKGPYSNNLVLNNQFILDGLVLGDGSAYKDKPVCLCIGEDDQDYFNSEIAEFILYQYDGKLYKVDTNITHSELPKMWERRVPKRYFNSNRSEVCSFLRGIYSANGSVCGNRITLKSSSLGLIEDVQCILSSIGIRSYYTTNKPSLVKFDNGKYLCKQSYDLNITSDRDKFIELIGFIQKYKNEKIKIIKTRISKVSYDIISIDNISEEEVFDITVDNPSHTYWTEGCNVSNCGEIGLIGQDGETGESGWQTCNLSSINGKKVKTKEELLNCCKAAAIIGTLQAGFDEFPYLGKISENIIQREALLGVSICGIMDQPDILLDPNIQKDAAKLVVKTNEEFAQRLGINPASRCTTVKPDGTVSLLFKSASGIHPNHARRYFRRVQANKLENIYQHFKKNNPLACEKCTNTNNDDEIITFCVEVEKGAKLKNDVSAIQLLEAVKLTQNNWIKYGTNNKRLVKSYLRHNVSNTVTVKENEWEEVIKYIYDNRDVFAGISLLSDSGDLDYPMAPFTAVHTPKEILEKYGESSLFVSGLIVKGLEIYDNNLWKACDAALGIGENLEELIKDRNTCIELSKQEYSIAIDMLDQKIEWLQDMIKFANRYLEGNIRKLTYLMKEVYNWKYWLDLQREYKKVNYEECIEECDNTKFSEETACGGGSCEIIRT